MARFYIEKLPAHAPTDPDVPGERITINVPDVPGNFANWHELLNWILDNPTINRSIRASIINIAATFSSLPKPR